MRYPREVLVVVGLTMGGTTAFYTYTTYMQKFLKLSVGLTDNQTTLVTAGSLVFALVLQPIYGALSDRIGRKPLLIWFGVMGTLFTIPLLYALQATKSAFVAFLLIAARVADRRRLHVDQRGREGGAVSDARARDRCRPAVRRDRVDLRRHRRVDRAVVQVDRPRNVVLLLPDRRHRGFARRLRVDARHPPRVGHGTPRVSGRAAATRANSKR